MAPVKLIAVGNSVGLVLPRDLLARLRVGKGDQLHVRETPDGIVLSPYDPTLAAQLDAVEQVCRADRDVLRQLEDRP